jgi:hypothetical protein
MDGITVDPGPNYELVSRPGGSLTLKKKGSNEFIIVQASTLIWHDYGKTPRQIFEEQLRDYPEYTFKRYYLDHFSDDWAGYKLAQNRFYRWLHRKRGWVHVNLLPPMDLQFWVTQAVMDHYNEATKGLEAL